MRHSPIQNDKGMALLLTISLISILAVITLQFSRNMRQEYIVSAGLKNSVLLGEIAKSGVVIAKQLLLLDQEQNSFDCLHDSWALLADEDLAELFDSGTLELTVFDESGKFQINAMVTRKRDGQQPKSKEDNNKQTQHENNVRNVLWRLLRAEPFLVEDGKAREIIDSLIDWIDSGDGNGEEEYGAEENYYQSLNPPYPCKNGPIDSIEELLLVKGFTRELLYGTEEKPALAALLTPLGDNGKVNINSAALPLLQAIANGLDKNSAENIISFREEEENKELLGDLEWYRSVPSFPGDIADKIKEQALVTVTSTFFTISAATQLNEQHKTITATVERTKDDITTLRWDNK